MRFSQLLEQSGLAAEPRDGDVDITAVCADSRRCTEGSVFLALRGTTQDAHLFIPQAIDAGAVAVVADDPATVPNGTPHAIAPDTREALGRLAQAIHGWPARKLTCIGVTGTNGKSTVTHLLRRMLERVGRSAAMLGTISYETGGRSIPAVMTTPEATVIAEMMAEMVDAGVTYCVMEVSSHALDQKRTAGIDFQAAIFTNLTGDHLDYHGTMEDYFAAKRELFSGLADDGVAVINRDDEWGGRLAEDTPARVVWYGLSEASDVYGRVDHIDVDGTVLQVHVGDETCPVRSRLIGRHNVYNALAAAATVDALGADAVEALTTLEDVDAVPGRLQRVRAEAGWDVFIDYAHTDDALANVLSSLRPLTRGRLIVVFGCGGDRDRRKRPRMARIAEELADCIVITSDNPRNEDPRAIIADVVAGLSPAAAAKADVIVERREAIGRAIEMAGEGDVVLIAGKGHETYQLARGERTHFDDAEIAAECIAARGGGA
ncbi:MAG: UDP-N-acetylmuramoyl-L-alanyl-D-glutamate--2,6-diaminopimelate ligase [Planctomycetes bacterium]|jgi:UDP-N-acetylmuramoyl-L-alanyl-D-glutamate--2,6-diaminopimelate ligase|nr:UDP-N-acetylmuramoyl-L-alanyl-D-glutamate--2,6-diaminopimelate ligase [Phycisphaerae bacterium]NBB94340.1 UDP-N-acetylmuramoyl-L-alanyl-D-glutamate--2,6-diaminopimelate ligase [Planctomycetota bacterium]